MPLQGDLHDVFYRIFVELAHEIDWLIAALEHVIRCSQLDIGR